MPLYDFLRMQGVNVTIERNGAEIATVKGLFNKTVDTHRKFCSFLPGTDIKPFDWIIKVDTGERFFVEDTESKSFQGKIDRFDAFYITATEHANKKTTAQGSTFNIQNAYGSIFGDHNTATINYQNSVDDIKHTIETSNSPDKEELKKIVDLLEMVVNNQVPASKGLFSKFADVMERNSWITGSIASSLISWLLSQIP